MKTVEVFRDFDYRPHRAWSVHFQGGVIYRSVIEAATAAIVAAGAGRVIPPDERGHDAAGLNIVDTRHVWRRR